MTKIYLTKEEQKAIRALDRLAKKWPKTLTLFSWSGSLAIFKDTDDGVRCNVGNTVGVPNDGGDPDDVEQFPEIEYED